MDDYGYRKPHKMKSQIRDYCVHHINFLSTSKTLFSGLLFLEDSHDSYCFYFSYFKDFLFIGFSSLTITILSLVSFYPVSGLLNFFEYELLFTKCEKISHIIRSFHHFIYVFAFWNSNNTYFRLLNIFSQNIEPSLHLFSILYVPVLQLGYFY